MSQQNLYSLCESVEAAAGRQLSKSQLAELSKNEAYLQKHKIHEICNQLVARLLETKPDKVKQQMIAILKKMKEKQNYFKKTDFQTMFESFDAFIDRGNGQIPYIYLIQALGHLGVHYTHQEFLNKYPQFKLEKGVKKGDFTSILDTEYRKKIEK